MTKSRPYRIVAGLLRVLVFLFQFTVAALVATLTGQTFQRRRTTRAVPWSMYEM